MKRKLEEGEFTFIFILLIISIILFILSLRMYIEDPYLSGPGSFPLLITTLMIVILGSILYRVKSNNTFVKGRSMREKFQDTTNYLFPQKIIQLIILILIYGLVLPHFGFIITTFLFLFLSMFLFYRKNIIKLLIISAGAMAAILIIFKYIFKIVLP